MTGCGKVTTLFITDRQVSLLKHFYQHHTLLNLGSKIYFSTNQQETAYYFFKDLKNY
jgi:hypothetical protein